MDSSFGLNIFTVLFLGGTFLAALVAGLGGFAFGIIAAAVWLYILPPMQTATLIMCLGLVVQGYSVWKLRHALHWQRLAPLSYNELVRSRSGALFPHLPGELRRCPNPGQSRP